MDNDEQVGNYLALFELSVPFTEDALKDRYRDLIQVWHPDRHAHNERLRAKAEEKVKIINQAYENLSENLDHINAHFTGNPGSSGKKAKPKRKSASMTKQEKYSSLASAGMNSGNHAEAYRYASKWLEEDPLSHHAWLIKGTSAGWQSTFLQPRLEEMRNCYSEALENAPLERREDLKFGMLQAEFQILNAFFPACQNDLLQLLPTAGPNAPNIWAHYVGQCGGMLFTLEELYGVLESKGQLSENTDLNRFIIAICKDNLEGVSYEDLTTVRFNRYVPNAFYLSETRENELRRKMLAYAEKLQAIDPAYVAPQVNKASIWSHSCFVATCVCEGPNHPYVLALQRLRDEKLRRSAVGREFITFYNRFGPALAHFIKGKPHLRKAVLVLLIRPLAAVAQRC